MSSDRERRKLGHKLQASIDGLLYLTDSNDAPIWETFQRLPLRTGTDYYKYIKNPISLHSVRQKVKRFQYKGAQEFIRDLVQISWNARLYNQRTSIVYEHAVILDKYIVDSVIPRCSTDKSIPDSGALYYPDLGPLPADDEPLEPIAEPVQMDQLMKDEEYEDTNDDDYEDYQMAGTPEPKRLGDPYSMVMPLPKVQSRDISGSPFQTAKLETGIRRGRPPTVDKPFETRIKLILKHFKKLRHPTDINRALAANFERLPDKNYSDYYRVIKNPISLFEMRAKLRARKYRNVDEFLSDLNLMFHNAKVYFGHDQYSTMYQDCVAFEQEANKVISIELSKSEKDVIAMSGPGGDGVLRFPLDSIELNGYTYRVGDWVLINNPNNPDKPTVGQVFRLWSTKDGTQYTNVCWYYRPEQTCHRYDRLFFVNEVCKTGQYRDHVVSEIVGPCYVIFLTRYQKGDLPKGVIPDNCPWFICEFRYNESSHVFNRIRTWRACLPDETRDNPEPPVVPLNEPRKLIKYESPIKALLPPGADERMSIPEVTEGPSPNTPPLLGSVYLREPDVEDDLGQYYTSANVAPSPENDDTANNRKAYIFTPISQSKMFAYPTSAPIGMNNGLTATTTATANNTIVTSNVQPQFYQPPATIQPEIDAEKSYLSNVSRFKPPVVPQQYQPPPFQNTNRFKVDSRKQSTPTFSGQFHVSTTNYSNALPGGTLSYTTEDQENKISSISLDIETDVKDGVTNIVWYRGPPLLVENRIDGDIGHSAKYIKWKTSRA